LNRGAAPRDQMKATETMERNAALAFGQNVKWNALLRYVENPPPPRPMIPN
jgi:hypothetical protein